MARKPRIEYEGAVYHVMSRGDRGGKIFKDLLDYEMFFHGMDEVCERMGWRVHSFVLLPMEEMRYGLTTRTRQSGWSGKGWRYWE